MIRKVFRAVTPLMVVWFFAWMAAAAPARSEASDPGEGKKEAAPSVTFPEGTATPSKICGECHVAIYKEFQFGFGSDLQYKGIVYRSAKEKVLGLPSDLASSATAHAFAGAEGYPVHAREVEEGGRSCNVCHYPEPFDILTKDSPEIPKPKARSKEKEAAGLTCASCHLTPGGKIRGPYTVNAPHDTVEDPAMRTSAMCAYCHSLGKRVEGKQTQTFLEWREDYNKPGLGRQHCQDCHMPRTLRKVAEDFDVPVRAVARHLWTGGHSSQRLQTALNMVVVQEADGTSDLTYHVINIGAGHSVPTGSNRRGIYLVTEIVDGNGKVAASKEWMFAPWYGNRPDDKAFLEEDKTRKDAVAATQADAQGPHEAPVRAGEERILAWTPDVAPGEYTVNARLMYDLNRYNERSFTGDQTEIYSTRLHVKIAGR